MEYFLMDFDKKGAEWVIVAYLSGDANMLSIVQSNADPHVRTGHLITGIPEELIVQEEKIIGKLSDPTEIDKLRRKHLPEILSCKRIFIPRSMSIRQCGKKSNHGLNYDEGAPRFALENEISYEEARMIVNLYKETAYPNIPLWYENTQKKLKKDRILTNCMGRPYRFLEAWGNDLFKSAYAFIPQSTVADLIHEACIAIFNDTSKEMRGFELLTQVHDSITCQYPIGQWKNAAKTAHRIAQEYMNPTLSYNGREFQIKTDLKVGRVWTESKMRAITATEDIDKLARDIKEAWEWSRTA